MQTLPGKTIILCGGSGNRYSSTGGRGDKFIGRLNNNHPKEKPVTTLTTALDLAMQAFNTKRIGLAGHSSALKLAREHVDGAVHLEQRFDEPQYKMGPARGLMSFTDWMNEDSILILLGDNLYLHPQAYAGQEFDLGIGEDAIVTSIQTSSPQLVMRLAHISRNPQIAFRQPPHHYTGGSYYAGLILVRGTVLKEALKWAQNKDDRPEFQLTTILTRIAKTNNMILRKLPHQKDWWDVATSNDLEVACQIYNRVRTTTHIIGK